MPGDDLIGGGPVAGHDVVVKTKLRFRVHPPSDPAVGGVIDRALAAYDRRLGDAVRVIAGMITGRRDTVAKAVVRQPFRPGSRGGTWYRDAKGNVRYGVPPEGKFTGYAPQDPPPAPENDHLRPRAFMGEFGRDQELTAFMLGGGAGDAHGLSARELRFLGAWYGTDEDGGALFDAFLECAGITRDDVKRGVTHLRFGSKKLTYEEAVTEFFSAQAPLFMGDDSADPDAAGWDKVMEDEVKPAIDNVLAKYEEAKDDERVQERFLREPAAQRRRLSARARRHRADTRGFADMVVGDWNRGHVVAAALAGMKVLGLVAARSHVDRHAMIHGRPHLRGVVMVDGRLFGEGDRASFPDVGSLSALTPSQLLLLCVAAELHRRWDPHTRSYSPESQSEVVVGSVAETALAALSGRSPRWRDASGVVKDRVTDLIDMVVVELNRINSSEGYPFKHEPGEVAE